MGLFDRHDYGRDFGREHGGHGLGDRLRGAKARFEARMGRGYGARDFAYRGLEGAWSTARNRGAHDAQWDWRAAGGSRYDQDTARFDPGISRGRGGGYDRGYGALRGGGGYDRGYGARRGLGGDYDRDLRGGRDRMRSEAGDPFGDRQNRTPFRVMRGGFDTGQTERGGWHGGHQPIRDRYDVRERGWNRGIGDEPAYRPEDFRGRDRGRRG